MKAHFFASNRKKLQTLIKAEVIVLAGHTAMQRSNDMSSFEQEANFWYLTGIDAADWWLIIDPKKSRLVMPDIDEIHQIFEGGLTAAEAKQISGVDEVVTNGEGKSLLKELAETYKTVATLEKDPRAKHYNFALNPAPQKLRQQVKKLFKEVSDCRLELAKLRAIKQPEEIEAIKKAVELTVGAFEIVKANLSRYQYEYQVEADFTNVFRGNGARGHAYDPIVASGKNACTLHYVRNEDPLRSDELILLDIGARVDGYAADITRTYSLGKSTERQTAVHRAVESAHKEIIDLLRPGLKIHEYQEKVDEIMKSKLKELGLLKKPEDYRKYFPHAISHGLGVDVHDALGRPDEFKEGMVLTVEPGIYIPEEGIGVRIEDDILITKTGYENLSASLSTSL